MHLSDLSFSSPVRDAMTANLDVFDRIEVEGPARAAAVAITLVPVDGDVAFVLTRRSLHLANHPGQWALPGGRVEADETATQAALRELDEEVGVRLHPEAVIGRLDDYVTRSGFRMSPVVVWAGDVDLVPDPAEVHTVHRIPVQDLVGDHVPRLITIPESDRPVIQIPLLGDYIHAPTAAVLFQFREVALHGRATRVQDFEEPVFAWR